MISVNGELISKHEAMRLIRMLCADAKTMAGEFHNMNRSAKFRTNWPNEYEFAQHEWKHFVETVRMMYAQKLGDPKTSQHDARMMHLAICLYTMAEQGAEKYPGLQIDKGSQQFWGDKYENKKIEEQYGKAPNFRAYLKRSTPMSYWTTKAELKGRH